ncbi:MAG: hypothetical protein J6T58_07595 [Bacteroidales bacterium]|nr:hypothetical protein [Bacteroidales bacterium]
MKRFLLILICLAASVPVFAQNKDYPSPDGKYCLTFNATDKQYYMHDNRMDYTYCITCDDVDDSFDNGIDPVWRVDSRYVYLSGKYDIWQIDITRAIAPLKIDKRKKDSPVKYFLVYDGGTLSRSATIYMTTVNTVTGESGYATFFQKGYAYRYRNYKEKPSKCSNSY